MRNFYTILALFSFVFSNAQCDIKTNYREDGNIIRYFNPKPVVKELNYEVGISIYYNETTDSSSLTVTVLFKNYEPMKIAGDLILQLENSKNSIKLPFINSNFLQMSGQEFSVALFEINDYNIGLLKNHLIKGVYFEMQNKIYGSVITKNKNLLTNQLKCLKL